MKNIKRFLWSIPLIISSFPSLALAYPTPDFYTDASGKGGGIEGFIATIGRIMDMIVPIMVGLALIYFIYGLGEYILESGEEGKKAEGRNIMIYGTIAMFVIVSIWGLVQLLQETTNVGGKNTIEAPKIPKSP